MTSQLLRRWCEFILGCCAALASGSTFAADGQESRALAAGSDSLPSPWNHQDIGAVEVRGSASLRHGGFPIKGTPAPRGARGPRGRGFSRTGAAWPVGGPTGVFFSLGPLLGAPEKWGPPRWWGLAL